jgi:LPXTG-site transpeptidase (sortase) family protein
MRFPIARLGMFPAAGVLALALSFGAAVPGVSSGLLGDFSGVAPVAAMSVHYSRVASLDVPTRATSISYPRLGINMPIRNGVLNAVISRQYTYHYPGTSWPGGGSNTYLYAHAQIGAFVDLKYARIGDLITLRLSNGKYVKYRVTAKHAIAWNDDRWLLPTSSDRLTLQTCLGPNLKSQRLVVIAVPAY